MPVRSSPFFFQNPPGYGSYVWCIESCFHIGITISPENDLVVSLNTSGVFVCKAESANNTNLNWLIAFPTRVGLPLPVYYYDRNDLDQRGVVVAIMNTTSTLRISGLPQNNNTVVYCTEYVSALTSQAVYFRVLGKYISSVNTWKMGHYKVEFLILSLYLNSACCFVCNLKVENKFVQDRPAPQTRYPLTS